MARDAACDAMRPLSPPWPSSTAKSQLSSSILIVKCVSWFSLGPLPVPPRCVYSQYSIAAGRAPAGAPRAALAAAVAATAAGGGLGGESGSNSSSSSVYASTSSISSAAAAGGGTTAAADGCLGGGAITFAFCAGAGAGASAGAGAGAAFGTSAAADRLPGLVAAAGARRRPVVSVSGTGAAAASPVAASSVQLSCTCSCPNMSSCHAAAGFVSRSASRSVTCSAHSAARFTQSGTVQQRRSGASVQGS